MRVAIVEDQAIQLITHKTAIKKKYSDASIDTFMDAESFLEKAKDAIEQGNPYHIVISDNDTKSEMTGAQVLEQLRDFEQYQNAAFFLVSGTAGQYRSRQENPFEIIDKPVIYQNLLRRIDEYLVDKP